MDGCSLNDAFPSGPYGSVDCRETSQAEISRRQEKKKARRCRGPALAYLNNGMNMVGAVDPDTPQDVSKYPKLNTATGLTEHRPYGQQYNYETFVGGQDQLPNAAAANGQQPAMDNLQAILKDVKGTTELQPMNAPSFFGASPDDGPSTARALPRLAEGFQSGAAPFVNVIGTEEAYKLEPDFTKAFTSRGAQKAAGGADPSGPSPVNNETAYLTPTNMLPNSILPVPNVDMFWKQNGLAGGQSSFFSQLRAPGGQPAGGGIVGEDVQEDIPLGRRDVLTKLDKIFARLDDMDAAKSENAQTEVLLFIMTGLGVIFLMDIGCRAAASLARR